MLTQFQNWAFAVNTSESKMMELLRALNRILLIVGHVFFKTDIPLRASALTYSIILSLVPMLAMSTAILKGLGNENELKIAAYRLIDQIDPTGARPVVETDTVTPATDQTLQGTPDIPKKETAVSMTDHLRNGVEMIFDYVDRTNFAALGAFGIVGLLFVVLLMLNNIEVTMNAIWHSRKNRPLGRKIMDYLALLILLPISLNVAFAGDAILQSEKMMGYITTIIPSAWLVKMLFKGLPFLFIVGSLTFMYQFFPYAKVRTYAAFTGALFSAVCWFIVQQFYITLQVGVSKYNAIYGSFATIPLFLVWLHLGWMFLLLGAALAYAVQNRNSYHPQGGNALTPQRRLQLTFDILQTVYDDFNKQQPTSMERLSQSLPVESTADLNALCESLIAGGLLRRVEGNSELVVTPALPMDQLETKTILELILGKDILNSEGGRFADTIISAAASGVPRPTFSIHSQGDTHAPAQ